MRVNKKTNNYLQNAKQNRNKIYTNPRGNSDAPEG